MRALSRSRAAVASCNPDEALSRSRAAVVRRAPPESPPTVVTRAPPERARRGALDAARVACWHPVARPTTRPWPLDSVARIAQGAAPNRALHAPFRTGILRTPFAQSVLPTMRHPRRARACGWEARLTPCDPRASRAPLESPPALPSRQSCRPHASHRSPAFAAPRSRPRAHPHPHAPPTHLSRRQLPACRRLADGLRARRFCPCRITFCRPCHRSLRASAAWSPSTREDRPAAPLRAR